MPSYLVEGPLNFTRYEDLLLDMGCIYLDSYKYEKALEIEESMLLAAQQSFAWLIEIFSRGDCFDLKGDTVKKVLIEHLNLKEKLLTSYSRPTPSLDIKNILTPLLETNRLNNRQRYFLQSYVDYRKISSRISAVKTKVNDFKVDSKKDSYTGATLYELKGNIVFGDTGRASWAEPALISIPKTFLNGVMTVPKDWMLISGDLPQIDFRIGYNQIMKTEELQKYFLDEDDSYKGVIKAVQKENFDVARVDEIRRKVKVIILSAFNGANTAKMMSEINDSEIVNYVETFFKENKGYQDYVNTINECIKFGVDIDITDYFGFNRIIAINNDNNLEAALNTPVQAGTNGLMYILFDSIKKEAEKRGISNLFKIYWSRHDEPLIAIHTSAIDHLDILANRQTILVDDWNPIKIKWNGGVYYGDEELGDLIDAYETEPFRITVKRDKPYTPIKKVFYTEIVLLENELDSVQERMLVNEFSCAYCRVIDDSYEIFYTSGTTEKECVNKIIQHMIEFCKENGYGYIHCTKHPLNKMACDYIQDIYFRFDSPHLYTSFIIDGLKGKDIKDFKMIEIE